MSNKTYPHHCFHFIKKIDLLLYMFYFTRILEFICQVPYKFDWEYIKFIINLWGMYESS